MDIEINNVVLKPLIGLLTIGEKEENDSIVHYGVTYLLRIRVRALGEGFTRKAVCALRFTSAFLCFKAMNCIVHNL